MYLVDDDKTIVNYHTNIMYPDYEAYDYTKTYNNGDVVVCLMDGYKYTSKSDSNNNFVTDTDYWDKGDLLEQKHPADFWCRDTIKYKIDDIVQYSGKTYKSLIDNNTYSPLDTYAWSKISDSVLYYEVWDSSKTYNTNDLVVYKKRDNIYYIYKSLADSNSNEPSKSLAWFEVSPENAYKSMDMYLNTTITQDSSKNLIMFFDAQALDSVSLLLINGTHIKMELIDTKGKVLLTEEKDLIAGVTDWGDYFAADLEYYANGFFSFGLQYHRYVRLEISTARHNTIEVGKVVLGHKRYLGELTIGVSGHIDDYSKKNIDKKTGLAYLEQGHYNKELNGKISLKTENVDKVFGILTAKRAKPTLYLSGAEDKFNRLNVYGFYKDFNMRVDNCVLSTLILRIQGLI